MSSVSRQWLIYAYAPEADEVMVWHWGEKSIAILEFLYKQLDELQVELFSTDDCKASYCVLSAEKHLTGKAGINHIEGVNIRIGAGNRRIVRITTCFSEKLKHHLTTNEGD